jgi:hypothetical protein
LDIFSISSVSSNSSSIKLLSASLKALLSKYPPGIFIDLRYAGTSTPP